MPAESNEISKFVLMITISFNYEKKEVIQALRYHFISRPEIRIMMIVVNLFALACAILFYYRKITALAFLTGSVLWFVLMASFWFFLPAMVYRRNNTFRDHFTMEFNDEGFTLGNERGGRSWSWNALSNFTESQHFFHLYFDSRSFFLVPKYACSSSDEVYELRQLLKRKV